MNQVHANIQVKNEARLLEEVIPEWMEYPIQSFVFLDDNSTDETVEVIGDMCDSVRYQFCPTVGPDAPYSESRNRAAMLGFSRAQGADVVISLDADELLTDPLIDDWWDVMKVASEMKLVTYQWNVVGSMTQYRQDPSYVHNYRDFIFPMKYTGEFDLSQTRYHTPRTPPIRGRERVLPRKYGFVHLQALNVRFYALKQLWYKTFEYVNYGKSVADINAAYDPVVNQLDFCAEPLSPNIIGPDTIDPATFDAIEKDRSYVDYILEYSVPELITFGEEYLK